MFASASRWCALVSIAALAPLAGCDLTSGPDEETTLSAFSATGTASVGRSAHIAIGLTDGRVLIAGGVNGITRLATAELFNPATGAWSLTAGGMAFARVGHAAVRLADGRVLVVGGTSINHCTDVQVQTSTSAEIYDPATGVWSRTGDMRVQRNSPTAVLLADGRVLVAGGGNRCGVVHASAEIYNPATGTWSATGSMSAARQSAAGVLLADGRVLVAGGISGPPLFGSLASAEIYDPATGATGAWTPTGSMRDPRIWTSADMSPPDGLVRLADGRVLTAGGVNACYQVCTAIHLTSAEIYDPAAGAWSAVGAMGAARTRHRLNVLPSGHVLALGGQDVGQAPIGGAELFDPATGMFSSVGSLVTARFDHSATALADGQVLIAAGQGPSGVLSSAEIFGANVNRAPVASAGQAVSGDEGSALSFSAAGSSDPDGDALTYWWNFGDGSAPVSGMSVSHVYRDNGSFTDTLTVSDGTMQSTATTTASVANVAPAVSYSPGDATIRLGQTFQGSVSFRDPGADSWSATVDYGDESNVESFPLSEWSFPVGHRYARDGVYTVTVTVTDDDRGAGSVQFTVTVQTLQQTIAAIIESLDAMAGSGVLRPGTANALAAPLRAAILQLDRENTTAAMNELQAFVHHVSALVRAGQLSAAYAQSLLPAVRRVMNAVEPGWVEPGRRTGRLPL